MTHAPAIDHTESLIADARELAGQLRDDRDRPEYHFVAPWGAMKDINGLIFYKGRFHLFYSAQSAGRLLGKYHVDVVGACFECGPGALDPSSDGA